jgi:hypothetical protein
LITHTYEDEMARDVAQDSETIAGKRGASTS